MSPFTHLAHKANTPNPRLPSKEPNALSATVRRPTMRSLCTREKRLRVGRSPSTLHVYLPTYIFPCLRCGPPAETSNPHLTNRSIFRPTFSNNAIPARPSADEWPPSSASNMVQNDASFPSRPPVHARWCLLHSCPLAQRSLGPREENMGPCLVERILCMYVDMYVCMGVDMYS